MLKKMPQSKESPEKLAKLATAEVLSYHLLSIGEICRVNGWYQSEFLVFSASEALEDMLASKQDTQPFETNFVKK